MTVWINGTFGSRLRTSFLVYWLLVVLRSAAGVTLLAAEVPPLEYQVKAAFLLNFTKFIEWAPPDAPDPASPIAICVMGNVPIGLVLEQMVEGESIGGRKLVVQKAPADPAKSCQLVFIGKTEKEVPKLLSGLGHNVLTVGEADGFLTDGGMINFVIENRRVRFDVNQKAVSNSALKLSSKLLNVARRVEK